MMKPEPVFDAIAIVARLENSLERVLPSEVHLIAYLSCLLFLYSGQPVADWGYEFASTVEGSPFSVGLEEALTELRSSGDLSMIESGYTSTSYGKEEYKILRTVHGNARRDVYIAGACASVLALPIAVVRSAMSQEPAMRRVSSLRAARHLLEEVDLAALYDQFSALFEALGEQKLDLMVPAVAWLNYLIKTARSNSFPSMG
jgi:hypothetical protein